MREEEFADCPCLDDLGKLFLSYQGWVHRLGAWLAKLPYRGLERQIEMPSIFNSIFRHIQMVH